MHAHLQGYQNIDRESSIEIMRFKKEGGGDSFPIEIEIQRESYVIFNLWKKRKWIKVFKLSSKGKINNIKIMHDMVLDYLRETESSVKLIYILLQVLFD